MDRYAAVGRTLRGAAPHELPQAARKALTEHFTATQVELLMADYAMTILQPVPALPYTTERIPVHASAPGRAFGAQEPYVESGGAGGTGGLGGGSGAVVIHLPVTVRGDRLGVLSVTLPPETYSPQALRELVLIAEALGHEIVVAERDTDLYVQARRVERLTLAAEMQWQLLPGRSCSRREYDLGGHLEPAYAVFGDNFDWSTSADHLTLTISNGMGQGISAALLTNLTVHALRNARRAGLGLADQACLADQAVYGQYRGAAHVSALLLRFDLATGAVRVIDAGSPKVWRLRSGKVEQITGLEAQLPLGMFEDSLYTEQPFKVLPGDRLLFVSDGVYDVASPAGERYSERELARALTSTRLLPPAEVPRAVLGELAGHRGETRAEDDATVVCLDWHGRP
ncbi:SpoIIE family protein phosphatase [Streptomyces sp. p1417]|uniref:SpoIIE family protein phosphatase n=1 Tax=Streptomyces typhae TaxID=2681492 RepID=A0A6L6WWC8_9ACTN|nr:SpoIIE family protein phosphatase [Streptomyces typhae]